MNELLTLPPAQVPEAPFFKHRFELVDALSLKKVSGVFVGDPVPVNMGINVKQNPSADPSLFPGIIGPFVILHHHDW
jgi:hypothetical protein